VTNNGTGVAHNVVVDVQVPLGLTPGQIVVDPPAPATWTGNTLWVAWGDLGPGSVVKVDIPAIVGTTVSGDVVSTARVQEYGLTAQAILHVQPQLLPPTAGAAPFLWAGGLFFAGVLVIVGLLLRSRRGQVR
jgi:hypothetical protein